MSKATNLIDRNACQSIAAKPRLVHKYVLDTTGKERFMKGRVLDVRAMARRSLLIIAIAILVLVFGMAQIASAKSMYLASQNGYVRTYSIGVDCLLTFQAASDYVVAGIDITLDGEHDIPILFITSESRNSLYVRNANDLSDLGTVTAVGATNLAGVVYDADNDRVYCVDRRAAKLYVYDWDYSTKTLTAVSGSPFTMSDTTTWGIALDQTNNKLYVSNDTTTVNVYDLNADGAGFSMAPAATATITTDHRCISVAVDEGNQYLYYGAGTTGGSSPLDGHLNQYNLATNTESYYTLTGNGVVGLDVDQSTHYVYISTNGGDKLMVFDPMLTRKQELVSGVTTPVGLVIPRTEVSYNPLSFTKDDGDGAAETKEVSPGDQYMYTITCENGNDSEVTGVSITDTLPGELDYISCTGSGSWNSGTRTITWTVGSLSASDGTPGSGSDYFSATLTVQVKSGTSGGITITNHATIDSSATPATIVSEPTTVRSGAPEIDMQRPSGTSIADGGTDDLGNQAVGTVHVTYTVDNTDGTLPLHVTGVTASGLTNCSNFSLDTTTSIEVAAGATATFDISFDTDSTGPFSFDMEIANNDADEDPYDIHISGEARGDINGDGIADVVDVRLCLQIACGCGLFNATAEQRAAADVDGDGDVDEDDATWIAEHWCGYAGGGF